MKLSKIPYDCHVCTIVIAAISWRENVFVLYPFRETDITISSVRLAKRDGTLLTGPSSARFDRLHTAADRCYLVYLPVQSLPMLSFTLMTNGEYEIGLLRYALKKKTRKIPK